jgi:hypothetical protein
VWTVPAAELFLCAYTRTSVYRPSDIPKDIFANIITTEHRPDGSANVKYHVCEARFFTWKQDISFAVYTQLRDALMATES